ncbi:DNA methyltransferase [Phenylobacterium sp.]|uniref:site-specific DNA-methyltransferase n=1 Tax=Phenylobacterium sp. TaxID=1871053 RepID=UPI0025D7FF9A|nr:DNA methyltransferase [Phenylobacterium sp.]
MTANLVAPSLRLVITYCPPVDLKPDPGNARTHTKKQVAQIAASMSTFGFTNPVLADEYLCVIAGHGRLLAAKQLGLDTVPYIMLTGLSEVQKRALRLADNKIASNAGWDPDLLRVELAAITELEVSFDITVTGFASGEIDVLLSGAMGADPDEDIVPAVPAEPKTKLGDIWILGEHRIGCGDCRDSGFLRQVMGPGVVADAAFLDPPYNVRIDGHANVRSHHREFAMASGEMTSSAFTEFLAETLGACAAVSRDGAVHFVCMDWRHMDEVRAAGDIAYGAFLNLCVWNKSNAGMGSLYRSKHELVFVYRVGQAQHFNAVELGRHGRNRTNVWDYASVNTLRGSRREDLDLHPTVKPVAMVSDAIKDVTHRGDVVLDAFLGSGTSLIAAEREGRRFRGLDIDPAYVDLAVERWVAMTGTEAVLEVEPVRGGTGWTAGWAAT